jgi:ABC-type nickel/cobalt efflux system permease component RcnA
MDRHSGIYIHEHTHEQAHEHADEHTHEHADEHADEHANEQALANIQTYGEQERTWTGTWICSMDMEMYKHHRCRNAGIPIKSLVRHR